MALPYRVALETVDSRCADLLEAVKDPSLPPETRANLRVRLSHWAGVGARIKARWERGAPRGLKVITCGHGDFPVAGCCDN